MPSPQPKERLTALATEHALRHGIVDASLREIAAAIGTSHRMLIYHFGSREGLLVAVVRKVERQERESLIAGDLSVTQARAQWDRLASPALRAQERLFFEIYAHALLERPGTEGFLAEVIDSWTSAIADAMVRTGVERAAADAFAHLCLAVTRGLLLDLLATDNRTATTAAFELYLDMVGRFLNPS